jgi:hypothetical protein
MARALKIQKYGTNQGITIQSDYTVTTGSAVAVDEGFPNFGSLTDPYYGTGGTLSSPDFLGVVGGMSTSATSATYPIILPQVNISTADGNSTGAGNGRIVRQKGSHKFLVAYVASTTAAGSFIVGQAYKIASVGNTDWNAVGHGDGNAAVGDEFTATAAGSGTGTVYPIGQCVLSNTGSPAAGYMSIRFSTGDSTAVYASYISNKWIRDWNGMTYGNYSDSNTGTNVTSSENFYPVNFFTDEGTMTWSGADVIGGASGANGSLQLAQVTKATS